MSFDKNASTFRLRTLHVLEKHKLGSVDGEGTLHIDRTCTLFATCPLRTDALYTGVCDCFRALKISGTGPNRVWQVLLPANTKAVRLGAAHTTHASPALKIYCALGLETLFASIYQTSAFNPLLQDDFDTLWSTAFKPVLTASISAAVETHLVFVPVLEKTTTNSRFSTAVEKVYRLALAKQAHGFLCKGGADTIFLQKDQLTPLPKAPLTLALLENVLSFCVDGMSTTEALRTAYCI